MYGDDFKIDCNEDNDCIILNVEPARCSESARPPRARSGYGPAGEKREWDLNEQLVASLKEVAQVAPALKSLQQERKETRECIRQQTKALMKLNAKLDSHEERLIHHQKQADDHEMRLKKVETKQKEVEEHAERLKRVESLLEQRQLPLQPPEEVAFAPAPTTVYKAIRALGTRKPTSWCKLPAEGRELLRRVALERMQRGRNMFFGAIGAHHVLFSF